MKDLPAARSYAGVMMLIPATITQAGANLDIQVTPGMLVFGGAGGRNNEARIQVDGLNTGAAFNGAGVSSYMVDISNAQEVATTTSGGLGEAKSQQATWTSPLTSKLLLEVGFGTYWSQWGGTPHPGSNFTTLIGMTEQCTAGCAGNGGIANLNYRAGTYRQNFQGTLGWRGSASYVTGAHSMKFGYQGGHLIDDQFVQTNDQFVTFRVNNLVPNLITENINQIPTKQRVRYAAFYAQESWTINRMTLQGALRYDRAWSYFPEVTVGPVRFLPNPIDYPKTSGVTGYNDITPRLGMAYDLFGTGRTSLKLNVGRYLQAAQNGLAYATLRPSGRLSTTVTRAWTDTDRDFVPDCDLMNPLANNGGDACAQVSDLGFGTERFTSDLDDKLVSGWGVRPGGWQIGASIQQQLLPRVSAEIGYTRRWLTNFTWDNNVLQATDQFDMFSITAPNDTRLPEEARARTIGGLYNVQQGVASQVNNVTMLAEDAGGTYSQMYNGILLNLSARMRNGLTFQGGLNTGTTSTDYCAVRAVSPEYTVLLAQNPTNPWCNTSTGWVTRYTGLGTYTIPTVDVLVSGTFRSDKGSPLAANMVFTSNQTTLGRPFANSAPNVTVNLVEPGTLYGDRVNEIDVRFAKILPFGRTRTNVGFDIYNILNANPILTYNQAFNPVISTTNLSSNWLAPQSTLQPRFLKFSAQIDF
jgi:hypothetical protein